MTNKQKNTSGHVMRCPAISKANSASQGIETPTPRNTLDAGCGVNSHMNLRSLCSVSSVLINKGQVIIEFTFCMIVIMIMIFGITKAFFWTGADLATRRLSHDQRLILFGDAETIELVDGYYIPLALNFLPIPVISEIIAQEQINPNYHTPIKMNAIWDGF